METERKRQKMTGNEKKKMTGNERKGMKIERKLQGKERK